MMRKAFVFMFSLVFFLSLVSSQINVTEVSGVPLSIENDGSFVLNISTNETETVDISLSDVTDSNGYKVTFTPNISSVSLNNNYSVVKVDYNISDNFVFEYKESYSSVLTLDGSVSDSKTKDIGFNKNDKYFSYSKSDNRGELEMSRVSLRLNSGIGDSRDGVFFPFDEVELEFQIKNKGDWDIRDIEFFVCLYDVANEYCIYDEDDFEIDLNDFNLDEGDREKIKMSIKLDSYDLEVGSENYELHFSAIGEIDDSDSVYDEDESAISEVIDFEIVNGQTFVIINEIAPISNEEFVCGDSVTINANAWNIDDTNLDDDEVFVRVYNKDLEIDEVISFETGIDYMDYEPFSFDFKIPYDIEEGNYNILFSVYNDERMSDRDLFEVGDVEANYEYSFNVDLCEISEPYIKASLLSDPENVVVGEEFNINLKLLNMGSIDEEYYITLEDYEFWADVVGSSEFLVKVNAGSEEDIKLNMLPQKSGTYEFTIVIESKLGDFFRQPVSVTINEKGLIDFGDFELIHLVLGILVVLIILVFVLIIVASKRNKKPNY